MRRYTYDLQLLSILLTPTPPFLQDAEILEATELAPSLNLKFKKPPPGPKKKPSREFRKKGVDEDSSSDNS